ncbi:Porin subfamily precursor [Bosea sp. LC85]|uniref:porin n=1 Tax=Bosea sp. LC85 TaxID=1502851 RepID=UPI0004E2F162|nr:porin [Bosea sp. LC85]KFC69576.1 Porin subfamily precursor [Bosea sp. LC85]
MKLVKSLLLGSAAGFAAVAGAQAADLPSRKAAPVEYVRVCTAYGSGFFYIPGTDSCLRIGGRLRAEYTFGERWGDLQDSYGTRARGRLNVDLRTATAYGTLRTFIRYDVTISSGAYGYGALNSGAIFANGARGAAASTVINLDKGFIQFGPITAGRAQSFFDFYANDLGFSSLRGSDTSPNLLAYTATFGSGFSATISLEDRAVGRDATVRNALAFGSNIVLEGQQYPDLVGALNVTQGWGSAQLSGAIGQRSTASIPAGVVGFAPQVGDDEVVWAIQGGLKFNLPMLAAGDVLWLQAAYAEGANSYLGYGSAFGYGRLGSLTAADIVVDPTNGRSKLTKGWAIVAGLKHYWTPTIRSEVYGSYSELDMGAAVQPAVLGAGVNAVKLDPKEFIIGTNLVWTPVSGLDIGVEVLYSKVELKNRILAVDNFGNRTGFLIKSDDALTGRLRIQRDF